jgi:hypothetical protein
MLLEQVDDCEQLSIFLGSERGTFSLRLMITWNLFLNIQLEILLFTDTLFWFFQSKGKNLFWGVGVVLLRIRLNKYPTLSINNDN